MYIFVYNLQVFNLKTDKNVINKIFFIRNCCHYFYEIKKIDHVDWSTPSYTELTKIKFAYCFL